MKGSRVSQDTYSLGLPGDGVWDWRATELSFSKG